MILVNMVSKLQSLAHDGYAMHDVEIKLACHNCDELIHLKDPNFDVRVDDNNKTVMLLISPSGDKNAD